MQNEAISCEMRKKETSSIAVNKFILLNKELYFMSLIEGFKPNSLLAFIVAISLVGWFGGILLNIQPLISVASSIFMIFAVFFIMFLLLTILRNIKKI